MFRLSSDFWNKFARKTLRAVFSLALAASCVSGAFAYTTENFDVDVTVGEDNSYAFSESVTVNFVEGQARFGGTADAELRYDVSDYDFGGSLR